MTVPVKIEPFISGAATSNQPVRSRPSGAGPGGGSEDKPVGTVWIAVSLRDQMVHTQKFLFEGDRNQVRLQAVDASLRALLDLVERG